MHYKNGREAKPGDRVIQVVGGVATGILHTVNAQSDSCNGRIATLSPNDAYVTIKDCLALEDIEKATIPDSSKQGRQ